MALESRLVVCGRIEIPHPILVVDFDRFHLLPRFLFDAAPVTAFDPHLDRPNPSFFSLPRSLYFLKRILPDFRPRVFSTWLETQK
jgi:hypothetical protein